MSPVIKIETPSVTYDSEKDELFVECVQQFHIRFSPFQPAPARYVEFLISRMLRSDLHLRLLVHLKLKRSDTDPFFRVITYHEDFYHPEDLTALLVPPLIPIVRMALLLGTTASNINSRLGAFLGTYQYINGMRAELIGHSGLWQTRGNSTNTKEKKEL